MKYRKLILILAVATLSLTACKKETVNEPITESVVEETTSEKADVVEEITVVENNIDNDSANGQGEVNTPSVSEVTTESALNPRKNITKNEDGTYSYTDEFLIAIQEIDGVANLNQAQLEEMLANITPILFEMPTEADIIALISSEVAWYEWGDFVEETGFGKEKPSQETNNTASTNGGHGQVNTEQDTQEIYVPEVKGKYDDTFVFEDGSGITHAPGDGSHVGISH